MNHGSPLIIGDDTNLQWRTSGRRANQHHDCRVICFECPPMVSQCVNHVFIGDTVFACARLDVHQSHNISAATDRQQMLTVQVPYPLGSQERSGLTPVYLGFPSVGGATRTLTPRGAPAGEYLLVA